MPIPPMPIPPMPIPHQVLLDGLLGPAQRAARRQLEVRRSGITAQCKADQSPVTIADQDSEEILLAALHAIAPGVPVIAEEAMAAGDMPETGDTFFLVDPLDGTKEYIAGGDDFTINVALIVAGAPRFGLVVAAASARLFATSADGAAIEAQGQCVIEAPDAAALVAVRIATREADPDALIAVASRRHRSDDESRYLAAIGVRHDVAIGSSLKFCLVARGDADVYPRAGRINEWDTAAGHAVLVAAGGVVLTQDGVPLSYGKRSERFVNPPFVAWGRAPRGRLASVRLLSDATG